MASALGTPSPGAIKRLQQEMKLLRNNPTEGITARPDEGNILLWHYVLKGPKGTPYEGGTYLGKLRFPPDYPFAPPSILMTTPNGRFRTEMRLCLSISDYHPKEWNPVWNVSTILTGLLSFMCAEEITAGSIETSAEQKKAFAKASHAFNIRYPIFRAVFSEMVEEEEALAANPSPLATTAKAADNSGSGSAGADGDRNTEKRPLTAVGSTTAEPADVEVMEGAKAEGNTGLEKYAHTDAQSNVRGGSTATATAAATTATTTTTAMGAGTGAGGKTVPAQEAEAAEPSLVEMYLNPFFKAASYYARRLIILLFQMSVAVVVIAFVILLTM